MTLNCSADNCIYNNYGICYAGNIKIEGEKASTTTGTTCATFSHKKENELNTICIFPLRNNLCHFTTSSDIECSAKKCNYNCFGTCTASSVQINFNNASCDTFVSF